VRISKVLLRRYKSFNAFLGDYPDRRSGTVQRPWNQSAASAGDDDGPGFGFVEIPVEPGITTIVGGNESGKSHLLSAISKVATGMSGAAQDQPYSRTDLCHFPLGASRNTNVWPEIGLTFSDVDADEWRDLRTGNDLFGLPDNADEFTLILVGENPNSDTNALLFVGGARIQLNQASLGRIREHLPTIRFIDAAMTIGDQVDIADLIGAYGPRTPSNSQWFPALLAQEAARTILDVAKPPHPLDDSARQAISTVWNKLAQTAEPSGRSPDLEVLLFRDVLGVEASTLEYLASLDDSGRSYADSVVESWNRGIEEKLNLARYWQQDDQFKLRVNFKRGTIFFEISDKTGAVYTFRERSSGLRYFLSYYIQAKAIEQIPDRRGVVLMDEPDSFLSVLGQRNLLAIFESLVTPDATRSQTQLIYSTHSPFLIDRNQPWRIRLIRKGDGEEGSQHVDQARVRRYEPVRSALGISCGQTIFMGATNLVLEGAVDQYLLTELVRLYSERSDSQVLLDLNSVVLVSGESASGIPKLIDASLWEDEPQPALVVLVDSDTPGLHTVNVLTGHARGEKKRLEPRFVLHLAQAVGESFDGQMVITTEDLIPSDTYAAGIRRWATKYLPSDAQVDPELQGWKPASVGIVEATRQLFRRLEHRGEGDYDKLGVAEEVVAVLRERKATDAEDPILLSLKSRMVKLCDVLRERLADSNLATRRDSTRQALVRHLKTFLLQHRESSTAFDLEQLVRRMQIELEFLGRDVPLMGSLRGWAAELQALRTSGIERIQGEQWSSAYAILAKLKVEPFPAEPPTSSLLSIAVPSDAIPAPVLETAQAETSTGRRKGGSGRADQRPSNVDGVN
jgi:hypothetical protein